MKILCYGDSNTWGYISGTDHQRYGENERWTRLLGDLLGNEFEIIEEGLNSRTLISNDTRSGKEGRNGFDYLLILSIQYKAVNFHKYLYPCCK